MSTGPSALYILDLKGKTLIYRHYRGDVPQKATSKFVSQVLDIGDEAGEVQRPIVEIDGTSFVYIRYQNLYLLGLTNRNANAAMILLFLYRIIDVFKEYFTELEEESIRDNFVIIYELLDEMMDFGLPQTTESTLLKEFIVQEGFKLEGASGPAVPPAALTAAVSWRKEGIVYRKNEVFLDVIENVNLLVSSTGRTLRSEIVGTIMMKAHLSGMPELRLGLNDRVMFESTGRQARGKAVEMEDVQFHQCVRLSRFENDRTISFIPPDGSFELMRYRLNTQVKPLIWVEARVDSHKHSRIAYTITVKSQYKSRSTANNVVISIPVPSDASLPKFRAPIGVVKYHPEKNAILWTIKQLQGAKEYMLQAQFSLPSIHNEEEPDKRPPISVQFEIPYFTVSGVQVRYLKIIERSGYQALPWVRYITRAGGAGDKSGYEIRMG
ncbi:MAG: AP-1 complex subunit mu [archaeon]|nr:AP-1 complex subunit mu [archaeon]